MFNLMKLELRKYQIRTYLYAVGFIALGALGFLYTFAMIGRFGGEADVIEFSSYENIWVLTTALYTVASAVLIAVMSSALIVKDVSGKSAFLLFTCPVDKKSLINAKILLIALIGIGGMLVGSAIIFTIFFMTELIVPLVPGSFTLGVIIKICGVSILCSILSFFIGIISARIGFIKKSVQATIVSAVLLAACSANVIAAIAKAYVPFLIIWLLAAILALITYGGILQEVQEMEV